MGQEARKSLLFLRVFAQAGEGLAAGHAVGVQPLLVLVLLDRLIGQVPVYAVDGALVAADLLEHLLQGFDLAAFTAVVQGVGIVGLGGVDALAVTGAVDGAGALVERGEGAVAGLAVHRDADGLLELTHGAPRFRTELAVHLALVVPLALKLGLHIAHILAFLAIGNGVIGQRGRHHRQAKNQRHQKRDKTHKGHSHTIPPFLCFSIPQVERLAKRKKKRRKNLCDIFTKPGVF